MASIPEPPDPGGDSPGEEDRHDYEVGQPLREGWGGTLREGRYRRTGRRVTVEELRRELTVTPGLVDRLAEIGRRAAAVRDPHLLAVYDLVDESGTFQLIAEWSEAPTVAVWVRGREQTPEHAVTVLDGVLAGLVALHAAGLFHGRVGAETVVVEGDGRGRLAELAVCAAAAPPGSGPAADVRAAARLGLDLLRGSGRRFQAARDALQAALDAGTEASAAATREALAAAAPTSVVATTTAPRRAPRRRRRLRRALVVVALLVLVAAGGTAAGLTLLGGRTTVSNPGPLTLEPGATVTVTPASGGCDTTFVFVGRGSLHGTGTLVYRWEQSDGQVSADTSLTITPDEGAYQLTQAWRIQGSQTLDASMTLHILKPADSRMTRSFHYACS